MPCRRYAYRLRTTTKFDFSLEVKLRRCYAYGPSIQSVSIQWTLDTTSIHLPLDNP